MKWVSIDLNVFTSSVYWYISDHRMWLLCLVTGPFDVHVTKYQMYSYTATHRDYIIITLIKANMMAGSGHLIQFPLRPHHIFRAHAWSLYRLHCTWLKKLATRMCTVFIQRPFNDNAILKHFKHFIWVEDVWEECRRSFKPT